MNSIPILLDDPHFVVCVKPAGISSEEEGMPKLLREQCHADRIFCVHRLDQAVSGIMVYAKDGKTAAVLSESLRSRETEKYYLAVIHGVPSMKEATLKDLLFHDSKQNKTYVVQRQRKGVREAVLDYTLLQTEATDSQPLSLVRILLGTGRSHQIRVQFASRNHPLVGDRRYGSSFHLRGPALFAYSLSFPHPESGKRLYFTAAPPEQWPWNQFCRGLFSPLVPKPEKEKDDMPIE